MYSKLVSIPDALMWRYFELLSFRSMDEINAFRADVEAERIRAISRSSWPKRSWLVSMVKRLLRMLIVLRATV